LLDAAGLRAGAVNVSLDGLDEPPLASIPDIHCRALSLPSGRVDIGD
jgi:hypothetical protein